MLNERKLAIEARDKFYFTGKKCIAGHISKRNTVDGSCYQCRIEKQKIERAELSALLKLGGD